MHTFLINLHVSTNVRAKLISFLHACISILVSSYTNMASKIVHDLPE
uniref:Uncharacterized protein n=1 Tax=Setaria italica TaxID=4555 RepID=K3Z1X2_SETIT